jgi:DNA uptake protein ComE-like DNA-binding protein
MARLFVLLSIVGLFLVPLLPVSAAAQTAADSTAPPPAASPTHTTAHHASTHKHHATTTKKPKIDINSATDEQLETLPGVTEAMSDKIVQNRPYKSTKDLVTKQVMTQAEYNKIHSQILAKQEPAAAK